MHFPLMTKRGQTNKTQSLPFNYHVEQDSSGKTKIWINFLHFLGKIEMEKKKSIIYSFCSCTLPPLFLDEIDGKKKKEAIMSSAFSLFSFPRNITSSKDHIYLRYENRFCNGCGGNCLVRISESSKNPNRHYFFCEYAIMEKMKWCALEGRGSCGFHGFEGRSEEFERSFTRYSEHSSWAQ